MKSNIDIYVINEVRKRREEMMLSQEALSFRIGRCGTFVGNVESGKSKYSVTHLNLIALVLRCSTRDFLPHSPIADPSVNSI